MCRSRAVSEMSVIHPELVFCVVSGFVKRTLGDEVRSRG